MRFRSSERRIWYTTPDTGRAYIERLYRIAGSSLDVMESASRGCRVDRYTMVHIKPSRRQSQSFDDTRTRRGKLSLSPGTPQFSSASWEDERSGKQKGRFEFAREEDAVHGQLNCE